MIIVLPALAVAYAAVCVWLAVRIINRREKWASWTAVALLVVSIFLAYAIWWLTRPQERVIFDSIDSAHSDF